MPTIGLSLSDLMYNYVLDLVTTFYDSASKYAKKL